MNEPWRIELFGTLHVPTQTQGEIHFRTARGAMLLAYLALKPTRTRTRDRLCDILWPEDEASNTLRTRLRWEMTWLRSLLGKDVFVTRGHQLVSLAPHVTSDVAEFEEAVLAASQAPSATRRLDPLRRALALYKDELLTNFDEEWVVLERARLRESFFESVLTRLILDLEHEGFDDEARQVRRLAQEHFPDRALPVYHYQEQSLEPLKPTPKDLDFYGRETDLEAIVHWAQAVNEKRLLTLTGMGGIGKTRLTREAIPRLAQEVIWVPLADLQNTTHFFDMLHDALKLPPEPHKTPRTQVVESLKTRHSLVLLLDNLEQIATYVAPLVRALLVACPHLKCLATSRRPLKLAEEKELALLPLEEKASVALFLSRARQVRPDFASTSPSASEVVAICRILEGIPLALELAAARALVLGPGQMREQLSQRLQFLISVRPQRYARHQSLMATILWSYELLTPQAQQVFAELSVFRGGIALELAQQVCLSTTPVLDALEELVLHSLLQVAFAPTSEIGRYDFLMVIREFAQTRLLEDTERWQQILKRHRECYARAAGELRRFTRNGEWTTASAVIRLELENFRVAMESSSNQEIFDFFDGLALILFELGLWSDFDQLVKKTELALTEEPESLRTAEIWGLQAAIARRQARQDEAWRYWERRLEVLRRLELPDLIQGTLLEMVGQAIDEQKSVLAHRYLNEAERWAEQLDVPRYTLELQVLQTRLALLEGNINHVQSLLRALVTQLQEGEVSHQARLYALHYLCPICRKLGFIPELEWILRSGLALTFAEGRLFNLGVLVLELARHREQQGELEAAGSAYYVAREIHKELQSRLKNEAEAAFEFFASRYLEDAGRVPLERLPWRGIVTLLMDRLY